MSRNLEARKRANENLRLWLKGRAEELETKGFTRSQIAEKLGNKLEQWSGEKEAIEQLESAAKSFMEKFNGADPTSINPHGEATLKGIPVTGSKAVSENFDKQGRPITTTMRDLNPLVFDDHALNTIQKSMELGAPADKSDWMSRPQINTKIFRGAIESKAFNSVEGAGTVADSLLPAQLMPGVVERVHEPRIADLLPTISSQTLSYEFISDSTSSNGVSGFTAEGATAPDVTLDFTETTISAAPIKATFGISYETQLDRPTLLSYLQLEVMKQFSDLENSSLLAGTGDIVGLNETSGISTVAVPDSLPTGANTFDYVISLIDAMRVSKSLANPNIGIVHPSTWHAMVAQNKDTLGRWLQSPDPAADIIERIWGIKLYLSTAQTAGTLTLVDTTKFGFIVLRESIRVFEGYNDLDFSQFLHRWGLIERLNLAVTRPTPVGTLTGLPTSFAV
jgi:HK97 family phage major capsid protein